MGGVFLSNKILNLVRDAKIGNPTAKEVLKVIADQANDAGTSVWSSIEYFVFSTERDRSTVKRALKFLQDEEMITHLDDFLLRRTKLAWTGQVTRPCGGWRSTPGMNLVTECHPWGFPDATDKR